MAVLTPHLSPTRALDPQIAAAAAGRHAAWAERERTLHPQVAAATTEGGFARHFVPLRWGGRAGGFAQVHQAAALVGEACASSGWWAVLQAAHGRLAAHLPEQAQHDLWAGSPDVPIAAAIGTCGGRATAADGGWVLEGRWNFASGVDHADWVLLAAEPRPAPGPAGPAGPLVLLVPREQVRIEQQWSGVGLRGSGSHSVGVTRAVVPAHRAVALAAMGAGLGPHADHDCHRIPFTLVASLLFAAPALGAARGAVRAWTDLVLGGPDAAARLAGDGALQQALARSTAEVDAAGLLLDAAARRADAEPRSTLARSVALNQRDCAVAVDMLAAATERLYRHAGARAQLEDCALQRHWRDVHAIAAHAVLQLGPAAAAYAAQALPAPARP
jgi:alkylation response protein AidB-like acyl-CoA dehydrogenase